jgi:hypothetical protein
LKALFVIALLLLGGIEARPQGQVIFNNRVSGSVVAPVFGLELSTPELAKHGNTASGTPAGTQTYSGPLVQGPDFTAQLLADRPTPPLTIWNRSGWPPPSAAPGSSSRRTSP